MSQPDTPDNVTELIQLLEDWRMAALTYYEGGVYPDLIDNPRLERIMEGDCGLIKALNALLEVAKNGGTKGRIFAIEDALAV